MLFRSFTGTVIVCALRLARQVCTASRRKLAAASRPTAREAADRHGAPKAKGTRLRVLMSVPKRDGTTRSNLCLYMLFRLFTGTVNLCAVRLARQVCTASRRKLADSSMRSFEKSCPSLAPKRNRRARRLFLFGASDGTRTRDLVLTKDALYLLSYTSLFRCLRPAMMAYNTIHSGVSPSQGD